MYRITSIFLIIFAFAGALSAETTPQTPEIDPADRLAAILSSRHLLIPVFQSGFPKGVPRELAGQLASRDLALWQDLEYGIAPTLRKLFDSQQLDELVRFYESDLGQAWARASAAINSRSVTGLSSHGPTVRRFSVVACVVDSIAPTIEKAKEEAKKEAEGEMPVLPEELLEASLPVAGVVAVTCDCIIGKAIEKWGIESLDSVQGTREYQTFLEELAKTGEGPAPKEPT